MNELSTKRHFIAQTAKLNQCIYFKVILTLIFVSKDILLWKRGSAIVSTEDRKLWIPYGQLWFDKTRTQEPVTQMVQQS